MARPLELSWNGTVLSAAMNKVDRSRLYGYKTTEALDDADRVCTLVTLASDGRTLIGAGGTTSLMLDADGAYIDRKRLTALDPEGKVITPTKSSFDAPVPLTETIDVLGFLLHDIRLAYEVELSGERSEALIAELRGGAIFRFPYSFRASTEPDVGFLMVNDAGVPFLLVGRPVNVGFVGLQTAFVDDEIEEAAETAADDDEIDFSMM